MEWPRRCERNIVRGFGLLRESTPCEGWWDRVKCAVQALVGIDSHLRAFSNTTVNVDNLSHGLYPEVSEQAVKPGRCMYRLTW